MSDTQENTERNVRFTPEQIVMPKPSMLERALGGFFRNRAESYIRRSIRDHAMTPDGSIDNELADEIRKRLTLRGEVSLHRDVVEPLGWAAFSGMAAGIGAVAIHNKVEDKPITTTSAMTVAATTALGAALDIYRVKRRFDSGLDGALSGALQAVKDERNPHWDKSEAEPTAVQTEKTESGWSARENARREKRADAEHERD